MNYSILITNQSKPFSVKNLLSAPSSKVRATKLNTMQIFITTGAGQTSYNVDATTSIECLKAQIENQEFIPSNLIRLVNGMDTLTGGSLMANQIEDGDSISLLFDVEGGMRKKWRKKRMRRLRRKRRKMRQRAR